jgi:hypothetical protein
MPRRRLRTPFAASLRKCGDVDAIARIALDFDHRSARRLVLPNREDDRPFFLVLQLLDFTLGEPLVQNLERG